jgi:tripartite-type tricarboxylate transporter receptor subunit TctC
MFMTAIQTDFTTVPYKGTAPAMNDLLGGQVDFMCDQTTNTPADRAEDQGLWRDEQANASLPNVPTMDEAGLKARGFNLACSLRAKGTPKPVVDKLTKALQDSLKDATVKQRFADLGSEPVAENRATPEAHRAFLKSETDRWGPIIKKAGVYAD